MRSRKFLLGSLSGAAVVFVVLGLMVAGVGRQPTEAAPGTATAASLVPVVTCTPGTATQATPGTAAVSGKQPLSAADQQMLDTISNAEWAAGAQTLGISPNDLSTALDAGTSVDQLAAAHHTTTAQVRTTMVAAGTAAVATALQQTQVTQAQADTLDSTLVVAIADKVTHVNQAGGASAATPAAAQAQPDISKSALPANDQAAQAIADAELGAVAQALGLSPAQFKVDLGCGSLATLPQAQHLSGSQIRDAALAAGHASLDQQVRAGALTQSQADALLRDLATPLAQKLSLIVFQPPSGAATPEVTCPATPRP